MQKLEDKSLKCDLVAKILVIGDGGVGKTLLSYRFIEDRFFPSYTATIGVDFLSKIIRYNDKLIKMQIWDTAGQQRFKNITQAYYRGAGGILLTFSLTDKASFQNIEKWATQIELNAAKDCSKILVGTKLDCQGERIISRHEAESLAIRMGVNYIQTSAKEGKNVDEAFLLLTKQFYEVSLRSKKDASVKIDKHSVKETKKCAC